MVDNTLHFKIQLGTRLSMRKLNNSPSKLTNEIQLPHLAIKVFKTAKQNTYTLPGHNREQKERQNFNTETRIG